MSSLDPGPVGTDESRSDRRRRLGLAALLGGMAILHVVQPKPFEKMIPDWVPGDPAMVNLLATAAEGGSAILLANRRTARLGGWAALLTFLGVYPANIQMALDGTLPPGMDVDPDVGRALLWARLPLQFPLFWWSWRTATTPSADDADASPDRSPT